jgi:hypothetical protein
LYDKTSVLPPDGSLREALFLTVWLKRQEAEVMKARMFAQAFAELGGGEGHEMKATVQNYKDLLSVMLPYMEQQRGNKDQEMKQFMEREVKKGVVLFQPQLDTRSPLVDRAEKMALPDDFRQKLAARKKKNV